MPDFRKNVLLVEDNADDAFLLQREFRRIRQSVDLHHVTNGLECMKFLRRNTPYEEAPRPDLILLDINMPIMDGIDTLREIVGDDDLCALPVIVMTTSDHDRDREEMFKLRCSSYIRKPVVSEEFSKVVEQLANYWLQVVVPPPAA